MNRKRNYAGHGRFNFSNSYNEHDDRTCDNRKENHDHINFEQRKGFNNSVNLRNHPYVHDGRYRNLRPLRRADFYEVKVPYGSKLEKENLFKLIHHQIAPTIFTPISYEAIGNDVVFYVNDISVANKLRRADRKIFLKSGHYMVIRVNEKRGTAIDANVVKKMKLAMEKRYIAENKALDLSEFWKDASFDDGTYCPLSSPVHLAAAMQIISENIIDLAALNLNSNGIFKLNENTCKEFKKLKNLKILHLEDNRLNSIHVLNGLHGLGITEIRLKKNPLCEDFKDPTRFVSEVRSRLPKLEKLDDFVLPKVDVPTSSRSCELRKKEIVAGFIDAYFQIYDSESRRNLEQAYHENAFFSRCVFYPPENNSESGKWCALNFSSLNSYIQDSKNLLKTSNYPEKKKSVHVGKENIVRHLVELPKTRHDLSSFAIDLVEFTLESMNLTVCGIFREPNASDIEMTWPIRYFSRTFFIVPFGEGFCIKNDSLTITNASYTQTVTAFEKEQTSTVISQSQQDVEMLPATESHALDTSARKEMVKALAVRTGMNLDYSTRCLDASGWNLDRAIGIFEELQKSKQVPPEAFAA